MTSLFKNSRDRLQRAADHARAFMAEWDALFDGDALRPELRNDTVPGWTIIVANFNPDVQERVSKNTLSLELGELAYQLRAALDGLIWDVVTRVQGAEPPVDAANGLDFPILTGGKKQFKDCGLQKFPIPSQLLNWLEFIQPGSAQKPVGDPDRGLGIVLGEIHDLARMDRHRRLRVVAAIPQDLSLTVFTQPPGGKIVAHESLRCDLFNGQSDIVRLRIECDGGLLPYHVRFQAEIVFDITVEGVQPCDGENVMVQLDRFLAAVEHTIKKFESYFP